MKLTKSQQEEIKVWEYFIPQNCQWLPKTDEDIKFFFEWSEQGKHKDKIFETGKANSYFLALREGKTWAGRHWQIYEDGVLDGSMPYFTILGGFDRTIKRKWWQIWKPEYTHYNMPIPREIVNQMKREMFKGHDAELIEKVYQKIISGT